MGVSSSIQLQDQFTTIQAWPWLKATTVVKTYTDGEYDFGIDFALVMALTGMGVEEAKAMIRSHAKNDTGIINALTFMITVIVLSESDKRNEVVRFNRIFDLFDFNRAAQITIDELAILILCTMSSFGFILNRTSDMPSDATSIDLANGFYEQLGKKRSDKIGKDELLSLVTDRLFKTGALSIDALFERLSCGPVTLLKEPEEDRKNARR